MTTRVFIYQGQGKNTFKISSTEIGHLSPTAIVSSDDDAQETAREYLSGIVDHPIIQVMPIAP